MFVCVLFLEECTFPDNYDSVDEFDDALTKLKEEYKQIVDELEEIEKQYPDIVTLTNS